MENIKEQFARLYMELDLTEDQAAMIKKLQRDVNAALRQPSVMGPVQLTDDQTKILADIGSQFVYEGVNGDLRITESGILEILNKWKEIALCQPPVMGQSEQLPCEMCGGNIDKEDKFTDEKHCKNCGWF